MADEVLEIVIREGTSSGGTPTPFNYTAPQPLAPSNFSGGFDQSVLDRAYADAQQMRAQVAESSRTSSRRPKEEEQFDPAARARELLAAEERRLQVQAELAKLKGPQPAFDPVAEAQRILDIQQKRLQVEQEIEKARRAQNANLPPVDALPAFDPQAEAGKIIEQEKRRNQIRAAYQNQTEGPGTALPAEGPAQGQQQGIFDMLLKRLGGGNIQQAAGGEAAAGAAGESAGAAGLGIAGAAGVAGAALVLAKVSADQLAKVFDALSATIQAFGRGFEAIVDNDPLRLFNEGINAATDALKAIPIVGDLFASQFTAAVAPIKVFTDLVVAFDNRAKQLEQYSPTIAGANIQREVRGILADIHEAEATEGNLARLIEAQSRAESEFREIMLPIKEAIVNLLANAVENMANDMRDVHVFTRTMMEVVITLPEQFAILGEVVLSPVNAAIDAAALLKKIHDNVAAAVKKVDDQLEGDASKKLTAQRLWALQHQVNQQGVAIARPIAGPPAPNNRPAIRPLFGGP